MKSRNIIINSLHESLKSIWKSKLLFLLLFVIQIAFLIIFSAINLNYQTKILGNLQSISEYMGKLSLDEASFSSSILQQKNILGEDPLFISRNFNEILKSFRLYLLYVFLFFIFSAALNWALAKSLKHKAGFKEMIEAYLKELMILAFYLGLIFAFFYSILNISMAQMVNEGTKLSIKYIPFLIFALALCYFLFISLSISHKSRLNGIVNKTLVIGIKKAHYVLTVYFINILLFSTSLALSLYFIEISPIALFLSIALMVFSLIFGRIFMINVVEKLDVGFK